MRFKTGVLALLLLFSGVVYGDAVILHSTDAGLTWTSEASNCSQHLNDVSSWKLGNAVAVGDNGTILVRNSQTNVWVDKSIPGITEDLNSVMFTLAGAKFWAGGENGRLLYSSDWGNTWHIATSAPFTINCLWTDPNSTSAIILGGANGQLYSTTQGWLSSGTTEDLYAFAGHRCRTLPDWAFGNNGTCTGNYSGYPSYSGGNTAFRGATKVASGGLPIVACGAKGAIYRINHPHPMSSVSSGTTANLYAVAYSADCNSEEVYITVGSSGTILRSTNLGVSWNSVFSGTTRQLNGVSSWGTATTDIYVVGNSNTSCGIGIISDESTDTHSGLQASATTGTGMLTVRAENSTVTVELFDMSGRRVENSQASTEAGQAHFSFSVPRGIYVYQASSGAETISGKLVISQ
ncbi:hypothetical protein CSA37_01130 [Candidatus Fermentibacteria bacterium]|nr:MAG: hypothetical protein CSA37_01130 [Candidatus Fermentibacteria bacterium]